MKKRIVAFLCACVMAILPSFTVCYADEQTPEYCSVEAGCYKIRNIQTGLYLTVEAGADNNMQKMVLSEQEEASPAQAFMIYPTEYGYYIRPESSIKTGRVVNAAAAKIKTGVFVNIFDIDYDTTMMWCFSTSEQGYIIHNASNKKCMMTVNKAGDIFVTNNIENPKIYWELERTTGTTAVVSYPEFDKYTDTTAVVNAQIFNPDNKSISKYGVTLFDADGNKIKSYGKSTDTDIACIDVKFDLAKVLKTKLNPNTEYKCSFYAVIDGEKFTSGKKPFKTDKKYRKVLAYGIDVSSWQGSVDWKKVAEDNIDFAILRAGFTDGTDNRFEEYYEKAREAGLDLGCYFYTYATSVSQSIKDAQRLLKQLEGKRFEYPIYIDIEDSNQLKINERQRTEICVAFMNTLAEAGYYVGTYSSLYWYNHMLDKQQIAENGEIWLAHWTEHTNAVDTYFGLWQYTSKGSVSGIKGNVDMDVAYVDYPSIIKANNKNGYYSELFGDADGDGKITMRDITLVQRYIAFTDVFENGNAQDKYKYDADNNGEIGMSDIVLLQLTVAGLNTITKKILKNN